MPNSFVKLKSTKAFLFFCCVFYCQLASAQVQVIQDNSVGVGTLAPHPSAKLEVHSETQGFLMPRMTAIQREAIVLPFDGLEVYCTDNDINIRGPWYYDGGINEWVKISLPPGGTPGQVLSTNTDGNYEWITLTDDDTQLTQEEVQDFVGPMLSGNTETGITVTYDDAGNEIDFVNTAPDQTVTITGTGGTVVTGTYPNFSISSTSPPANTNIYTDDGTLLADRNVDMDGKVLNFDDGRIELNDTRNNVFLGDGNGASNTTGSGNTAIGTNILSSNTTGLRNVGIGFHTLDGNTTGDYNIAMGYTALRNVATTNYNIALGYQSMLNKTGGANNVGIGTNTLKDNLAGANNIAIGPSSMAFSTGGSNNVAMGNNSLRSNTTGINNVAIGNSSLFDNTTGRYNVALGVSTLANNTTGQNNFASPRNALVNNTTGSNNVAIGYLSLQKNISGPANIGIGVQSLRNNTTGLYNTGLGGFALVSNTTGDYNIGIGQYALRYNQLGNYNVGIGYRAGWAALGSNNVFIGKFAGFNETGSNKLYIENTNTANPLVYGEFDNDLLRINGTLHATKHIQDSNNSLGNNGQLLGRDAGGVVWQDVPMLPGGGNNGQILATDGNGNYFWTNDIDTDTNTQLTQEQVQDHVGPMLIGNTEIGIQVTYDDNANEIDFVNTAPDQVVTLTGTGGAVVTGTYPDFTINAGSSGSENIFKRIRGNSTTVTANADNNNDILRIIGASGTFSSVNTTTDEVTITNTDRGSSQTMYKRFKGNNSTISTANLNNDLMNITGSTGITTTSSNDNISILNTDRGSSQNIFRNIRGDNTNVLGTANQNNDTYSIYGGTGISTVGSSSEFLTINNTDGGTSQNIFKQIRGNSTSVTALANNNNDVLRIYGSSGINTTVNTSNAEINVTNTDRGSFQSIYKRFTADNFSTQSASWNNDLIDYEGGTGISTSASTDKLTITNTAPDIPVNLSGGTGISVTGSYPNFTVTNTAANDTDWVENGNNVYNLSDNIGIGTSSPTYDLGIVGVMDLATTSTSKTLVISGGSSNVNSGAIENIIIGDGAAASLGSSTDRNVIIGVDAANAATSIHNNAILGNSAGFNMSSGLADYTVAIGYEAAYNFTGTGQQFDDNVFIGHKAGYGAVDGERNVHIGANVNLSNGAGEQNTFIGTNVAQNLTSGNSNVWIGYNAGANETTGVSNTLKIANGSATSNTLISGDFNNNYVELNGDVLVTGDFDVNGTVNASVKNFKIDHPLDPENKDLVFASIEAPEMLNMFRGNVVTDGDGFATVKMPDYFSVSNTNFSYHLTCIGVFAQAIVVEKIERSEGNSESGNQFRIQTDKPNVEVSWQVLAQRDDEWARNNPLKVEREKEQPHIYDDGSVINPPNPGDTPDELETEEGG